MPIMLDSK